MNDGSLLVHDPEVNDRVHLDADVVLGDDVLGRHVHGHSPQADANHFVDERDDDHDTGPIPPDEPTGQATPSKDHGTFVFPEHIKAHEKKHHSENQDCKLSCEQIHLRPLSVS